MTLDLDCSSQLGPRQHTLAKGCLSAWLVGIFGSDDSIYCCNQAVGTAFCHIADGIQPRRATDSDTYICC